ncbi:sensor histidine kinase [Cryobacterium adonitolivorans]|uniref:histidine kinase n=1 Tax=Cryobacterium adonitolivorans TaxID=1259189 RepID=A0A4R8W2A4_9MICO|nr:sensor histidine kinase [Cryobacterium adonitolivorans]TFC01120.1 sensor histidine kinase [Cryobacterium adonitolivorans]
MYGWSIARRLFLAHFVFIVSLAVFVGAASFVDARDRGYTETTDRMLAVATTIADSPLVVTAAKSSDPTAALQAYTLAVSRDADLDFITIMSPAGIRWTHPDPAEIGRQYIGETGPAAAGSPVTEVMAGTLGPSVRAVVPILDPDGAVVGMVAAGVKTSNLQIALNARLPAILALALTLLLAGSVATWILGRYLRRVTLGWGPEELAQLFVYNDSVLHSVREGLVLVDRTGDLVLYNDQAAELLGIPPRPSSRTTGTAAPAIDDLDLPASLADLLRSGRTAQDEIHLTETRVLVVSQEPAVPAPDRARTRPEPMGTVATIRDHTDLESLGTELASMRTLSDALRAQTHEHANRLHTIVSLMELGRADEALEFATQDMAVSQQLTDEMISSVDEPVIGALLVGKFAQAGELGVQLRIDAAGTLVDSGLSVQDLVTVLGNLVDNALEAAVGGEAPRRVDVAIRTTRDTAPPAVVIEVADSGRGVDPDELGEVFTLGYSTKEPGRYGRGLGLALVRQAVTRLGGTLTVSRRLGAVFTVTIPLRAPVADPEGTE